MSTKYPKESTGKYGLEISFAIIFGVPIILIIIATATGRF